MKCSWLVIGVMLLITRGASGQSCSGMLEGRLGLSQPDASGALVTIPDGMVEHTFGAAECECDTRDIQLDVAISRSTITGNGATAEIWVGQGCDDYATRSDSSNHACEKLASLDAAPLTSGLGGLHVPLPSRAVFAPVLHNCAAKPLASQAYVIVYEDAKMPLATCVLPLAPHRDPPAVAAQIAALTRASDGTVSVSITPPTSGDPPVGYQLLCATTRDEPFSQPEAPMYSVCPGTHIERRGITPIAPAGTLSTFDTAYVCSDMIAATATRVDLPWINRTQGANFLLLTVDAYGNFVASTPRSIGAAPAPIVIAPHGCSFVASGEGSSPALLPLVLVLAILGGGAWRRRDRTV
jgi:MYXO-CTERM domain-containing protein